jgi:NitT/TauT family transport system ATP-binding protein
MELEVQGISHSYGDLQAVSGIDLTVGEGEILALVGPSGCGKSTLLSIMGGMLRPSSGQVLLRGTVPPESLNPFTFIFQDFALLPWRTVERNVSLPLEHHRLGAAVREARVVDVLQRTGLSEFRAAYPRDLSGGMRQRVGIARALIARPAILFMDEPFSALDAQTRDLLLEDFVQLWARGEGLPDLTGVYVTHNLNEALRLADRIAVLSRRPGRVRDLVPVPLRREERDSAAGRELLTSLHERLWSLLREEARDAERQRPRRP